MMVIIISFAHFNPLTADVERGDHKYSFMVEAIVIVFVTSDAL